MTLYSTLAATRVVMSSDVTGNTIDNQKLLTNLRVVSRRFDSELASRRPVFAPYLETRKVLLTSGMVNSSLNTLTVPGPLLAITSISVGSQALVVGTNVEAWPDASGTPITTLRLIDDCMSWYSYCSSINAPLLLSITGVWGIHRDYANAWMAVDTLAGNITSSAGSFTVTDIDGADAYGITPRISAGNLLKIDDEYIEVNATDTATNIATVRRGGNGTTAAAHSAGVTVYRWQIEEMVERATARQAGMMYSRFGAYTTVDVSAMGGETRYPADLLTEVRAVINEYSYGN